MTNYEATTRTHEAYSFDDRFCLILWMLPWRPEFNSKYKFKYFKLLEFRHDRVILSELNKYDGNLNRNNALTYIISKFPSFDWQSSTEAKHFERQHIRSWKEGKATYNFGGKYKTNDITWTPVIEIEYGNRKFPINFKRVIVTEPEKWVLPLTGRPNLWQRLCGVKQEPVKMPGQKYEHGCILGIYYSERFGVYSEHGDIADTILSINQAMMRPMLNPETGEWVQFV